MAVKKKKGGWQWFLAIILLIAVLTLADWFVNKHHAMQALHKIILVK